MQGSSADASAELGRYRQAADVAYKYAKSRLNKEQSLDKLDKEEADVNTDIKETERS
jgi:hypothetical protein